MKYMESIMKKIPYKANKYMTNPCTANQTRKTSKEKNQLKNHNKINKDNHNNDKERDKSDKTKPKNEGKSTQSQSSSVTKIKNMIIPNTNDFKNLLTKYSLISNITSQSHSKKQNIQHKNINNNNNNNSNTNQHKDNYNLNNYIKTHGNNTIAYHIKTTKNNNIISANLTSIKPNKNKYIKKGAIKPMSKTAKKNLSSQVTLAHNIINNKLFNIKNQTTFQANQPYLHTIFPTPLHTYKHIEISNDDNHLNKKAKTTMEVKGKNSNVEKKIKNSIDKERKQMTYSKQLNINQTHHSSSHSNTLINKGIKVKESNNKDNESNLQESMCRENMYYNDEHRKLVEYIKSYYSSHFNEYPPTSLQFYKIGRRIGHGAFGKVNICLHILTGRVVAIKSFNRSKNLFSKKKILNEVKLMKKLKGHKNIIKVYEIIETEKYYCIVMENISGGNLLSLINKSTKLTEEVAKFIFKQLIEALKYMHSQGITHRDIKPENILIDLNNNIKICDFGVGKEMTPGALIQDTCGTPAFVAPELLSEKPYDPFQSDVWSSGVLLYSMLTSVFPFRGNNDAELHRSILSGNYPKITEISSECSNLVHHILEINPLKRITVDQILLHPWLNKGINTKICLFTNAEKIIYSKLSVDYKNAKKEDLLETFTYRNIDTELENENQNVKTKSFIITPYNSGIIDQYDEDIYYSDLQIENQLMKFLPKINELNRDYEVNYNAEKDQGFVINNKKMNNIKRQINSIHNSFEKQKANELYNCDKMNNNYNEPTSNHINNLNENEGDKNNNNKKKNIKDTPSTSSNTLNIDDNILRTVEEMGYKRDYIMKSLENNELNHSTTTYFIIQNTIVNE